MRNVVLFILFAFLITIIVFDCYAEGNFGVNLSRAVDETNWGAIVDYEQGIVGIEGNIQAGDFYKGNADLALTFGVSSVAIELYSRNVLKGHELATIGRDNHVGANLVVPIDALDVKVGLFGRNGNPFASRTALSVLEDEGVDGDTLPDGLADIIVGTPGLSIKDGSSVNMALETELTLGRFEVEAKGLLEVLGEGEKAHQFLFSVETDGNLTDRVHWNIVWNVGAQKHGEVIEYETDWLATVGIPF